MPLSKRLRDRLVPPLTSRYSYKLEADESLALMVHGGGHILLSRKDIRPKQTEDLLRRGFLPVSVDYRLAPEVDFQSGAMTDLRDAVQWVRYQLPYIGLSRSDIQIDSERLVVVGWSTGGTIAMTSAWTTVNAGLPPPSAIFALYCPTDYEDPCKCSAIVLTPTFPTNMTNPGWRTPNYPNDSAKQARLKYDLLEGVRDHAVRSLYHCDTIVNKTRANRHTDHSLQCPSRQSSRGMDGP